LNYVMILSNIYIPSAGTNHTDNHPLSTTRRKWEDLVNNECQIVCSQKEFDAKLEKHLLEKFGICYESV
jgi:hypothetical protein